MEKEREITEGGQGGCAAAAKEKKEHRGTRMRGQWKERLGWVLFPKGKELGKWAAVERRVDYSHTWGQAGKQKRDLCGKAERAAFKKSQMERCGWGKSSKYVDGTTRKERKQDMGKRNGRAPRKGEKGPPIPGQFFIVWTMGGLWDIRTTAQSSRKP